MTAQAVQTRDARAEDAALLARAASGDEGAFRALYDAHHRSLFRLAYGVLLDGAEAREAVQEAFLRLHRAAPSWEPRAPVGTWLYRVVLNHCLGLRKRLLRLVFAPSVERGSTLASPERGAATSQSILAVKASLATMSAKQRAVATLYLEAEMPPHEIAELLGITANAARVTLHRALHTLRSDLRAAGVETPDDDPTFYNDTTPEEEN